MSYFVSHLCLCFVYTYFLCLIIRFSSTLCFLQVFPLWPHPNVYLLPQLVLAHCHVILFPSAYFQSCCPSLVRSSQCFHCVTVCFVDFVSLQIMTSLLEICLKSAFVGLQPSLNRTWCKPVRCVVIDIWHIFMGIKAFEYLCTLPLPASP